MFSVALIGPDGAGKTTLTAQLQQWATIPVKCLYMGVNIEASNHALPTPAWWNTSSAGKIRNPERTAAWMTRRPDEKNAKRSPRGWVWAIGR